MNILRQNNIEVTPKRSKIHLFSNFCQTNISHNPHKKEYAMKFSQVKKHFPHLKSCILFRGFIGIIGGLILYVCQNQGRIYYEANEASASGPHQLGGPHQNFNAVSKVDFYIA